METTTVENRFTLIVQGPDGGPGEFADAVAKGLSGERKSIPCRYLYDHRGSLLFEDICALDEYYPTRAEREILETRADEIASLLPENAEIVELGSGNARKTTLLIESFLRKNGRLSYNPIDISRKMIEGSSISLLKRYPDLEIQAIAGDYGDGLELMRTSGEGVKLILWLGSSVGNLDREEAAEFLSDVRGHMGANDRLLIGIDLRKSKKVLEKAYDDRTGITAKFNMNLLRRMNDELGASFDIRKFAHRATYHEEEGRVDMELVSVEAHTVRIESIDLDVAFREGETIHTESCYKYSPEEIDALFAASGLENVRRWLDSQHRFSLSLAAPLP